MTVPSGWIERPDDTPASVFLAASATSHAWVRVLRYPSPDNKDIGAVADGIIGSLRTVWKGGDDPIRSPSVVDGRPSVRIRWRLPLSPNGEGPLADQTFDFVQSSGGVIAFVMGVLDGQARPPDLDQIAATLKVL